MIRLLLPTTVSSIAPELRRIISSRPAMSRSSRPLSVSATCRVESRCSRMRLSSVARDNASASSSPASTLTSNQVSMPRLMNCTEK